jgi:hypothetical protein
MEWESERRSWLHSGERPFETFEVFGAIVKHHHFSISGSRGALDGVAKRPAYYFPCVPSTPRASRSAVRSWHQCSASSNFVMASAF